MNREEIFTQEELQYLHENARTISKQISWEEIKEKGIIIYGLGQSGKDMVNILLNNNIMPTAIVDKNLNNTFYETIPVHSPNFLSKNTNEYVLISGAHTQAMHNFCIEQGVENILFPYQLMTIPLGYAIEENVLETLATTNHYTKLYNLLSDALSKKVLKDILTFRITENYEIFHQYSADNQYFPLDLKNTFDYSVFCDCGAYNGDTFIKWLNNKDIEHKKYIAIEASKKNFLQLQETVKNYPNIDISLHYCALGKEKAKAYFSDANMASTFNESGNEIDVCRLSDIISEDTTFIKMDIEGSEIDTIHGMKDFLINKKNSTLAISTYHKTNDIYEIPFAILQYCPNAKIFLRHESKSYLETVCYVSL